MINTGYGQNIDVSKAPRVEEFAIDMTGFRSSGPVEEGAWVCLMTPGSATDLAVNLLVQVATTIGVDDVGAYARGLRAAQQGSLAQNGEDLAELYAKITEWRKLVGDLPE